MWFALELFPNNQPASCIFMIVRHLDHAVETYDFIFILNKRTLQYKNQHVHWYFILDGIDILVHVQWMLNWDATFEFAVSASKPYEIH